MAKKEKLDKRGFTIGVRHFLNNKLKGKITKGMTLQEIDEVKYSIYVQITVKGQSIKVKSSIPSYFTEKEYKEYLKTSGQDLKNEEILIRRQIIRQNPFEDPDFVLKWSSIQEVSDSELNKIVSFYLHKLIVETMEEYFEANMIRYERFWRRSDTNDLPCRILSDEEYAEASAKYFDESSSDSIFVNFYDTGNFFLSTVQPNYHSMYMSFFIPKMKELRDEFPPEFWDFSGYYYKMVREQKAYMLIIDDLFTGRFDDLFMNTWHDADALNAIHSGFAVLCSKAQDLQDTVEEVRSLYLQK